MIKGSKIQLGFIQIAKNLLVFSSAQNNKFYFNHSKKNELSSNLKSQQAEAHNN